MKLKTLRTILLVMSVFMWTCNVSAQQLKIDDNAVDLTHDATLNGSWLKAGKVSWSAATKTLTLDNAKIENSSTPNYTLLVSGVDITIKLSGKSEIGATSFDAIRILNSKTTITGGGTLKVNAGWNSVYLHHDATLTINDCTVDIDGNLQGWGHGDGTNKNNNLVVSKATLKATCIRRLSSVTLTACKFESPVGGQIVEDEFGKFVATSEGEQAKNVSIVPDVADAITHSSVISDSDTKAIYSTNGFLKTSFGKGINIVRSRDGKTIKVLGK